MIMVSCAKTRGWHLCIYILVNPNDDVICLFCWLFISMGKAVFFLQSFQEGRCTCFPLICFESSNQLLERSHNKCNVICILCIYLFFKDLALDSVLRKNILKNSKRSWTTLQPYKMNNGTMLWWCKHNIFYAM